MTVRSAVSSLGLGIVVLLVRAVDVARPVTDPVVLAGAGLVRRVLAGDRADEDLRVGRQGDALEGGGDPGLVEGAGNSGTGAGLAQPFGRVREQQPVVHHRGPPSEDSRGCGGTWASGAW